MALNPEVTEIEIVCIVDDTDTRRCFSIAVDRDNAPVRPEVTTKPASDIEWYNEFVAQLDMSDPEVGAIVKDWS